MQHLVPVGPPAKEGALAGEHVDDVEKESLVRVGPDKAPVVAPIGVGGEYGVSDVACRGGSQ